MEKIILNLEDVIHQEKALFIDSGFMGSRASGWYGPNIAAVNTFFNLDSDFLDDSIRYRDYLRTILSKENTQLLVTSKVLIEIDRFKDLLCKKFKSLEEAEKGAPQLKSAYINKTKFGDLSHSYKEIVRLAGYLKFIPENMPIFRTIENMIIKESDRSNAKQKSYIERPKKFADNRTDEELVASAVYNSVINNQPSSILTKDSDLGRILNAYIFGIYANSSYTPLLESLNKNPVLVYSLNPKNVRLQADSSQLIMEHSNMRSALSLVGA